MPTTTRSDRRSLAPVVVLALTLALVLVSWVAPGGATPARADSGARAWPGGEITFTVDLPRRYGWSVRKAVRSWNRSMTAVHFQRVPADQAQLVIRLGDVGTSAGRATVGYTRGVNWVEVRKVPLRTWQQRQLFGRVLTHELGHVLGLSHRTTPRCSVLQATISTTCIPPLRGSTYACRWLHKGDVGPALQMYGGEFRAMPRWCSLRPRR